MSTDPDAAFGVQSRFAAATTPRVGKQFCDALLVSPLQEHIRDQLLVVGVVLHVVPLGEEEPVGQGVQVDGARGQEALGAEAGEQVLAFDDQDAAHGDVLCGKGKGTTAGPR